MIKNRNLCFKCFILKGHLLNFQRIFHYNKNVVDGIHGRKLEINILKYLQENNML